MTINKKEFVVSFDVCEKGITIDSKCSQEGYNSWDSIDEERVYEWIANGGRSFLMKIYKEQNETIQ